MEHDKANGVSLVAAAEHIDGECLLTMADHLYSPELVRRLVAYDLPAGSCALAVDHDAERCFDIEDATKVRLDESRIAAIGKTLERYDDHFVLRCRGGSYRTRAVLVAGGKGAFEPMVLDVPGYERLLHRGVEYAVGSPEVYRGRCVVIVGGGDSALDWALILKEYASRLTLVHRRDGWRAHQATVRRMRDAVDAGEIELRTFHEVREIHGSDRVEAVTIFDNRTDDDTTLEADAVLTFLGFKPDLGPIKDWGLELEGNRVRVNPLMETNVPGVFAAGDVVTYEGKLDLIATGFAEAAIAVNNAVHFVDPGARVNPGHSTNMKVFKNR